MNYLDLFSGIGGFSKGFKDAGFQFTKHYFSEIDKYAESIYRRHFPNAMGCGDVTKIGHDLEKIDIITAGFPCQSFSIAGNRGGFEDTRGTLFFEIERIARFYKPSYMVLENVKGLFSHNGGNTIRTILDRIRRLDYTIQLLLLNTLDFGIPQNRERTIFICTLRGQPAPEISDIRSRKGKTNKCANCINTTYGKGVDNHGQRTMIGTMRRYKNGEGFREMKNGSSPAIMSPSTGGPQMPVIITPANDRFRTENKITETVPALMPGTQSKQSDNNPIILISDSGPGRQPQIRDTVPPLRNHDGCRHDNNIFDGVILRRLTPLECERLQGFPDDWTRSGADNEIISDTQRYKCIGNAVTVNVIREVAKAISNYLK